MANPKVTETFADKEKLTVWFENSAKRHSNWNVTNTHFSQATNTISPKDVASTVYFVCDYQGFLKKAKVQETAGKLKAKRVHTESIKDGCKAKIIKKTLHDGSVQVDYLWQHATHQPEKVQEMVQSRLPSEVKQWIVSHVDNNMDWKAIKTLLQINPHFPISLRINYYDVQNVINVHLNNLSRGNAIDKTSLEQWIEFLEKEKNYLVHIVFHEVVKSNVTNKGVPVCFFVTNAEFITILSQWLNWVKSNCSLHVKRVMTGCSPVEISALEEVFGQSFQILLCHWHIKRAWEMHIKKDIKITGATHKSKREQDAVRVAFNLLMHARSKEAFNQQYKEFVSRFAGHAKFVAYFATHWHAKYARFHMNNLIESYHHILKAYYLGRSRNFRDNRLVYMLSQVVEHDYRQEGLKIMSTSVAPLLTILFGTSSWSKRKYCQSALVQTLIICLSIAQNQEVQVVGQSEGSAMAQNRLRALEFVERYNSLINKITQAFSERNAVVRDTASGMDITSQILEDCLSSLKESGGAPQQKYRKQ
ncbi:hypothetical protein PHYBLDRAFT_152795 [Phycomyces blakesleeanus NRRL 1555(-)]|uniref:MULE transposase domain-containing protein n=1 Tax=Phycomyces blakesleeanus (strain ATCC 8743b / DSM 1359 / FGSC 10004 / NBRC 33097 / NRRL 1555) TaxID=763407 RepID=A0A162T4I1_PHYB8|nr:hypothetical protein PHYBLDRAFT_152795 [Phycomyces blakesleeanus NRRL 1555(-)]OAD66222.1 hypothetical protein PHYBLDRAFT_152795 [Phycomyces blakesleeanus NRRL 1555(-)]|eukprot:XP_018284262.1 hypothetical protein PHYBLDRAFT_152795 [Phycomyces blakesleeanus NRRL 1555(-)]